MAYSFVHKLKILKTFHELYKALSRRNFESPVMTAAIVWLLPMSTQLRKCAADDIVPSLKRLKKYGSELKLFVSILQKLDQINIQNRAKWQPLKIVRIFLTYISHKHGTIKPLCRVAIMSFFVCHEQIDGW